ncbi:11128_t:CDS:2, partial [Gigaspora margarita]
SIASIQLYNYEDLLENTLSEIEMEETDVNNNIFEEELKILHVSTDEFERVINNDEPNIDEDEISSDDEGSDLEESPDDLDVHQSSTYKPKSRNTTNRQQLSSEMIISK